MSLHCTTRTAKCTFGTWLHLACLERVQNFSVPLQRGRELPQSCGTPLGLPAGTCFALEMTEFGLVFMGFVLELVVCVFVCVGFPSLLSFSFFKKKTPLDIDESSE